MEITGILKVKSNEVQVSDKFRKREFVVTDNSSQYPQHILFQLTQDKCSLLDKYTIGDELKVLFNLRGREWTDKEGKVKYFNSLEAWKIEGLSGTKNMANDSSVQEETFTPTPEDDLPF